MVYQYSVWALFLPHIWMKTNLLIILFKVVKWIRLAGTGGTGIG
tara:strand:- start:239 stop:370 length:132 start_codon:yes stop_codon:yes gene_type:complete